METSIPFFSPDDKTTERERVPSEGENFRRGRKLYAPFPALPYPRGDERHARFRARGRHHRTARCGEAL